MSALEASALRRDYGAVEAVRGVSLAVEPGELYGLVGPDGAGKTTTIGCLAGLMHPTSGSVRVLGQDPMARGSTAHTRKPISAPMTETAMPAGPRPRERTS